MWKSQVDWLKAIDMGVECGETRSANMAQSLVDKSLYSRSESSFSFGVAKDFCLTVGAVPVR